MRDRLTHDYFTVDLSLVWRVVEKDLELSAPEDVAAVARRRLAHA